MILLNTVIKKYVKEELRKEDDKGSQRFKCKESEDKNGQGRCKKQKSMCKISHLKGPIAKNCKVNMSKIKSCNCNHTGHMK